MVPGLPALHDEGCPNRCANGCAYRCVNGCVNRCASPARRRGVLAVQDHDLGPVPRPTSFPPGGGPLR